MKAHGGEWLAAESPSQEGLMPGLDRLVQRVDAVLDAAVAEGRIVGTVVLVTENGVPAYARAAGQADRELGTPTSMDTIFRFASLTKPMTSATALALVERGWLTLDDPITKFLPEFRPQLADGRAPDILMRHLLTHTAGFGYPTMQPGDRYRAANVSTGVDQPGLTLQENLERIASVPLYFPPGSAWRYGLATDVLGAVIAAVVGGSLADAIAEYVTDPLGMRDTSFTVTDPARLATPYADGTPRAVRMTEPHAIQDLTFSPARAFDDRSFQSGGGGMVGTADDFMTFLETLRRGGPPILDRDTMALASTNQVGTLREREAPGWGFGLLSGVLLDPELGQWPSHVGTLRWSGVWGNAWFIDPAAGITVVMLSNTALEGCVGGAFPQDVAEAVYAGRQTSQR
jgi:CubicO group peptidase (beta-lactamase class C family)